MRLAIGAILVHHWFKAEEYELLPAEFDDSSLTLARHFGGDEITEMELVST